jgi:hypothetical protein
MLRVDKAGGRLVRLADSLLANSDHWERDLQAMICTNPDAFCEELNEDLWVIGQEVRPSETISDRIDILAIDEEGKAVIIELKRGSNKLQLLQAISYAGMVARWDGQRFIDTLAANYSQSADDAKAAIEDHTGSDIKGINSAQRILLIAEDFDPALLIAGEWLHESYDVDIRCYRLQLSQEGANDYLTCTCIYPPIEIAALTRGSGNTPTQTSTAWTDWGAALEAVDNGAVRAFFQSELAKQQEARLAYRELIYRKGGKRRFWLSCRKKYAYVWQWGRFGSDVTFWQDRLSEPNHVQPVSNNRGLRFHLGASADFVAFGKAMSEELSEVEFLDSADFQEAPDGAWAATDGPRPNSAGEATAE